MTKYEFANKIIDEEYAHKAAVLTNNSGLEVYDMAAEIYVYTSFCDYLSETNDFTDEDLTRLYEATDGKVVDKLVDYYYDGLTFHDVADYEATRRFIEAYIEDEVYI